MVVVQSPVSCLRLRQAAMSDLLYPVQSVQSHPFVIRKHISSFYCDNLKCQILINENNDNPSSPYGSCYFSEHTRRSTFLVNYVFPVLVSCRSRSQEKSRMCIISWHHPGSGSGSWPSLDTPECKNISFLFVTSGLSDLVQFCCWLK